MKSKINLLAGVTCAIFGTVYIFKSLYLHPYSYWDATPAIINYGLSFINLSIFYFSNKK
jgi:hypothetical protein